MVANAQAVTVEAGAAPNQIIVSFTVPEGTDITSLASDLADQFSALLGIPADQILVEIDAAKKRADMSYTATITFVEADSASQLFPLFGLMFVILKALF